MKIPAILLAFFFYAAAGFTQQPATAKKTYIQAGHLLDVKTGKLMNNVLVTIENGKISAVGSGAAPGDGTVIKLPNSTLLPGLIDAHTHLTFDPEFGYEALGISTPKEALI